MSEGKREWRELYVRALLETNPLNLTGRALSAEKAIFARMEELGLGSTQRVERNAIADAISSLSVLRGECKSSIGIQAEIRPAQNRSAF
jgi:hypothetical protein